nr:Chain A, RNA-binding protein FUS [Homo sapiens]
SYSSYG